MEEYAKTFDHAVTVRDVRTDANVRAALGFGDSVRVIMNGISLSDDAVVPNGARLLVETAANTKAVLV